MRSNPAEHASKLIVISLIDGIIRIFQHAVTILKIIFYKHVSFIQHVCQMMPGRKSSPAQDDFHLLIGADLVVEEPLGSQVRTLL